MSDKKCIECADFDFFHCQCQRTNANITDPDSDFCDDFTADVVNHPAHYTQGGIECIDAIRASMTKEAFCGYCKGNVIKYLWRCGLKDDAKQELEKARWYLDRWLSELEKCD